MNLESSAFADGSPIPKKYTADGADVSPPPRGKPHRYYFKLYALKALLTLAAGATKAQLEAALQGRILEEAQWMGTYQRS